MDNQLNYQQAKSVRNRSIKDLIADELIRGKGLGGAIGGAIGLKSQARMKGIKEKFDPLNIVKFLTFGSRLGPALYGKLFGRSRKDIEYFTGRASPIGERKKKITGLSGQGEGEDTSGMKVVLNQILKFLQKSHEKDMVLREKENNLRESSKLKDDKRHTDLLEALKNIGFAGEETATKEKGGGLLDGLKKMIESLKAQIQSFIEDFKNIKTVLSALSWVSKLSWLRYAANPYALAAMLIAAGIFAIYNQKKEIENAAAEGDVERLKSYFSNSIGSDEGDMYAGGMSGYNEESVKGALEAAAVKGSVKAQEALDNFDKLKAQNNTETTVKTEKQLMDEYLNKKGFSDRTGKGDFKNYKYVLDSSRTPTEADITAAKEYAKSKMANPEATPVSPAPAASATPVSPASASSSATPVSPAAAPVPAPASAPPAVSPPTVDVTPKSSAVNTATDTNVSLNLSAPTSAEKNQAAQNKTNVVNKKAATGEKVPMPLVRNKEETFQRMIYNSLRLV